jgi:hypothetical protein
LACFFEIGIFLVPPSTENSTGNDAGDASIPDDNEQYKRKK